MVAEVVWVIVIVSYSDKSTDASTLNHAQACFLFLQSYLVVGETRRQYKTPKVSITRKEKDVDDSNNKEKDILCMYFFYSWSFIGPASSGLLFILRKQSEEKKIPHTGDKASLDRCG